MKKKQEKKEKAFDEVRDEEVSRANRELAAYFKGRRTEREARAALKIIKAFVRDREQVDPGRRRPLPGAPVQKAPPQRATQKPRRAKKAKPLSTPDVPAPTDD
jgi:hypothetical protein